jgi:hypothetical protein
MDVDVARSAALPKGVAPAQWPGAALLCCYGGLHGWTNGGAPVKHRRRICLAVSSRQLRALLRQPGRSGDGLIPRAIPRAHGAVSARRVRPGLASASTTPHTPEEGT